MAKGGEEEPGGGGASKHILSCEKDEKRSDTGGERTVLGRTKCKGKTGRA